MRLFFAVKLELSDRDLNQNGDGKNRKKKKKKRNTVDSHYLKILCLQIYPVTEIYV